MTVIGSFIMENSEMQFDISLVSNSRHSRMLNVSLKHFRPTAPQNMSNAVLRSVLERPRAAARAHPMNYFVANISPARY